MSEHRTVKEWLYRATLALKAVGIESARLDALVLLEEVLNKPRVWLIAHDETTLNSDQHNKVSTFLKQRVERIPLAYIIGSKEFYGRTFVVGSDVLIPRPETEAIIDLLKEINTASDINTVIDLGTGSGILAITAQLELPNIHVSASDISQAALSVARKNAKLLGANIRFHVSDLLENLSQMPSTRPYVILTNLPYVPKTLITSPEITKEPGIALFSEENGMKHYSRFWQQIAQLKSKPEHVLTESLEIQHQIMVQLAEQAGYTLKSTRDLIQHFSPGSPTSQKPRRASGLKS